MNYDGSFKVKENNIVVTDIKPHVAIKLKALFPKVCKSSRPPFAIRITPSSAEDFEWFLLRYKFKSDKASRESLESSAEHSRQRSLNIERALNIDCKYGQIQLNDLSLRDYQTKFVSAFMIAKKLLCGDDVGLGKTFNALGILSHEETRPALIVVQSHVVRQWILNISKHLGLPVAEIKTTNPMKESLPLASVYVTTYHRIHGWVDEFSSGRIKTVIFDEIQELRHSDSVKYKSAKHISEACEFVLGLSASPVYNYGGEIFNVMEIVNPGFLGSRDEFLREWCNYDMHGRVANPKALGAFLRDQQLMIRRTYQEVGRELPVLNKIVHEIPYDQKEHDRVSEIAMQLASKTLTGSFVERGQAARELDIMLRMATGVAKAKFVAEYVKIILENGERVLLAGWHRNVYEVWLKELAEYNPVLYTGSESGNAKHRSKEEFVNGNSQLMIISLRSGVGLDGLQNSCSMVVFGELDWSPEVHKQVIGRLQRDGQKNQVTSIFLVTDNGSDPVMVDLLGLKAQQSTGIMDLGGVTQTVSEESRVKEMARRFLEQRNSKEKRTKQHEVATILDLGK